MPFKRAGWLQLPESLQRSGAAPVSMPFKRAGWLQPRPRLLPGHLGTVSMPFKRAGWLQRDDVSLSAVKTRFQCPLSGLVGCNTSA